VLKLKIAVVFLAFVFSFLACSSAKPKRGGGGIVIAQSKTYEASLYRQNCAICHGAEALGKDVNGVLAPSLRFGEIEKKSEQEIYEQIAHGKLPMPSFKNQLTDEEIRRLVKFIRRDLQAKDE
jgi:cytochrome c553